MCSNIELVHLPSTIGVVKATQLYIPSPLYWRKQENDFTVYSIDLVSKPIRNHNDNISTNCQAQVLAI